MKNLKIIVAVLVLSLMGSCYSDKGNYEYHEINEATISGLPESEAVYFKNADTLFVTPVIGGTIDSDENLFEYKWSAISYDAKLGTYGSSFDIGTTKNLKYFITLPEDNYKVNLFVKEKKTGVTWRASFPIKVSSITKEGWIVLQNYNGDTRLDMISLPGGNQEIMVRDMLKDSEIPYSRGPRKIKTIVDAYGLPTLRYALMTDMGTTHLDATNLSWDETMNYVYEFGKPMNTIVGEDIYYIYMDTHNIFMTDKDVYQRGGYVGGKLYGTPINNVGGKYVKISPYVLTIREIYSPAMIFYDETNKQFVQMVGGYMPTGFTPCTYTETYFTNKTDKDMVYAAPTYIDGGRGYAILKAADSKLWLYGYSLKSKASVAQVKDMHYELNFPNIDKAKYFAFHPTITYLFYATEDKLYQVDLGTKDCKEINLSTLSGYNGNVGEKICYLNFNLFYTKANSAPHKELRDMLIVGSYDPSQPAESNGHIRLLKASSNFNDNTTIYRSYKDFAKPVDVAYKE